MSTENGTAIDKSESLALSEVSPSPNGRLTVRKRFRNYFLSDDFTDVIDYPQYSELGYLTEMKLIRQAQAGDVNARNVVWASNIRLVYSAVNHFHVPKSLLANQANSMNEFENVEQCPIDPSFGAIEA